MFRLTSWNRCFQLIKWILKHYLCINFICQDKSLHTMNMANACHYQQHYQSDTHRRVHFWSDIGKEIKEYVLSETWQLLSFNKLIDFPKSVSVLVLPRRCLRTRQCHHQGQGASGHLPPPPSEGLPPTCAPLPHQKKKIAKKIWPYPVNYDICNIIIWTYFQFWPMFYWKSAILRFGHFITSL